MKIVRNLEDYSKFSNEIILSIGNFDGVHLGHRKIINYLVLLAKKYNLTPSLMFFYPHTKYLDSTILSLREKINILSSLGIEQLFIINIKKIKHITADEFIDILTHKLHTKMLITGKDFCFGKDRIGNTDLLKQTKGFKHYCLPKYYGINSTMIRGALSEGELERANSLLRLPYHITGKVITGENIASSLGYPTANIFTNKKIPLSGVFASKITIEGKTYFGATNIGYTPTTPSKSQKIETHIFDFSENIYGKYATLELLQKIRDEKKFDSLKDLQAEITRDIEKIKCITTIS